jgi:cell wall assembly regulator SMI1
MSVNIVESEAPVTKERIEEVEQTLGIKLPEQYKAFLLKHNGGGPRPSEFLYLREGEEPQEGIVSWFLAIHDGAQENFLDYYRTFQHRIPKGTLPIARDPGGSLIVLGLEEPLRGKVFFWDKESEPLDGSPTEPELLYWVADSFEDFLSSFGKV